LSWSINAETSRIGPDRDLRGQRREIIVHPEVAVDHDAGVVHEDVQLRELVLDRPRQVGDRLRIGHVAADRLQLRVRLRERVELVLVTAGHDDLVVELDELVRERQADPGAAARDENRISRELHDRFLQPATLQQAVARRPRICRQETRDRQSRTSIPSSAFVEQGVEVAAMVEHRDELTIGRDAADTKFRNYPSPAAPLAPGHLRERGSHRAGRTPCKSVIDSPMRIADLQTPAMPPPSPPSSRNSS